ncbi:MAG: family 10 glycosylhydrolase, partial [Armatimonadota bacterium]
LIERVKPDWVQWDCKGHPGYTCWPTDVGWTSPGVIKDSLAILRDVTAEAGVALLVHYSGVIDAKAIEEHPRWAARDVDGEPNARSTSTFSDYVDELMIPQLREVVKKYDVDGMWIDGDCWGAVLDWSPMAVEAWKRESGVEPPTGPEDEAWLDWKEFHRGQFLRYLERWVDALHETKPELDITSNWMYSTYAPVEPEVELDYLSGDFSQSNSCDRARLEARYLASTGKPWDLMAWGFNRSWAPRLHKPAIALQQEAGVVLMQGGAFQYYYQPTRTGRVPRHFINTAAEVAEFCRARQAICQDSVSVPQVALLLPTEHLMRASDRVFHTGGEERHDSEGLLHALLEEHYSVDVMAGWRLMGHMDAYSMIAVPNATVLADDLREALVEYLRGGGSLLLGGPDVARMFEQELGVRCEGTPKETVAHLDSPLGMGATSGRWQTITQIEADEVALRYPTYEPRHGVPAATVASLGGGMIGAAWGPVGEDYRKAHHPAARHLIAAIAERLLPEPMVEVEAPPHVDVSLRRAQDGRICAHLLNLSCAQRAEQYLAVEEIPTVGPIEVRLRVNEEPVKVTWEPGGEEIEWQYADGVLTATVPQLHVHGAVVVG